MMELHLSRIAEITGGELRGADAMVRGMSHDSRTLAAGNLFAALPGEHAHGHRFLAAAAGAGAAGALVSEFQDPPLAQVRVADVRRAMGELAAHWRALMPARVAGITGSNGKTTVKEMLTAILAGRGRVLATRGNYNNEIGLPLTLAGLGPEHDYAVLEMGASRPGDIAYLAGIARPEVGVVTNAGPAHLEGFGSLAGVARAKGEMFESLPPDGVAVINRDDPHFPLWEGQAGARSRLTFGTHPEADVRVVDHGEGTELVTRAGRFALALALPGSHNRLNAAAATAAAMGFGVDPESACRALAGIRSLPGRLQLRRLASGAELIDDSYNANPASVYAGLSVLAERDGERWLILGDMAELGPEAVKLHAEIGQAALDLGVVRLFAIGPRARAAVVAFGEGAEHFEDLESLVSALEAALHPKVVALVKGSRLMNMERVVERLIRERAPC